MSSLRRRLAAATAGSDAPPAETSGIAQVDESLALAHDGMKAN